VELDATRVLVGLDEFVVLAAREIDGELIVDVAVARGEAPCPACGVFSARVKERRRQRVRDDRSFGRPTTLVWFKRRFHCQEPACDRRSFTESTGEVPARSRLTERLRRAIGRAARSRSIAAVAAEHQLGWWTTWRAARAEAERLLAQRPQGPPARLGLDETTFRRPQRFATGLVDLDSGRLWDLVEGRSKKVVTDRLAALGVDVASIEDVVIDPFAGYKAAVRHQAPLARRTADKFHIVKLAGQAVTDVRCRRQQELTGHRGRHDDPFYRARRDLLRARERLSEHGWDRLQAAFRADPYDELECAWTLKEALRDLYTATSRADAERDLHAWHDLAARYDVPETNRLGTTLRAWEHEILNYFDSRLSNGPTEGRNLIIKQVKRQGFGYRNFANYRLRVLHRCA
jgi:transposase